MPLKNLFKRLHGYWIIAMYILWHPMTLRSILTAFLTALGIVVGVLTIIDHYDVNRKDLPALDTSNNAFDETKLSALVKLHDRKTGEYFCSGTVIANNYILTAAHCVENYDHFAASVEVRDASGAPQKTYGTPVYKNPRSDLALILGDFSKFNQGRFTDSPIQVLTVMTDESRQVLACGFPYSGDLLCVPLTNRGQYGFGFGANGWLYPGMSGGPVLDYQTGVIVGVNTMVLNPGVYISPLIELFASAHVIK